MELLCPICKEMATVVYYDYHWSWLHSCRNGVEIAASGIFDTKEAAEKDWEKYTTMLLGEIMYNHLEGYEAGYAAAMEKEKSNG